MLISRAVLLNGGIFKNLMMIFPYFCFVVDITLSQDMRANPQVRVAEVIGSSFNTEANMYIAEVYGRGHYAHSSSQEPVHGLLYIPKTAHNKTDGCQLYQQVPKQPIPWVAMVYSGGCNFAVKVDIASKAKALGIIVVDNEFDKELHIRSARVTLPAILVNTSLGHDLVTLLQSSPRVFVNVSYIETHNLKYGATSKASVMLISISFIVLMFVSIIWMIFYYIQRFRYAHAKERLARQLMRLGKKSLSKMPTMTLKAADLESEMDACAVCLDNYQAQDTIRTLPCKHIFHKDCVDSWLISHRSCPICKCDILKALGMQLPPSYPQDTDDLHNDLDQTSFTMSELDGRFNQMELVFFPPARGRDQPTLVYVTPADYPELEALMRERAEGSGGAGEGRAATQGESSQEGRGDGTQQQGAGQNRQEQLEIVEEVPLEIEQNRELSSRSTGQTPPRPEGRRGGRWGRGIRGLFTRRNRQL